MTRDPERFMAIRLTARRRHARTFGVRLLGLRLILALTMEVAPVATAFLGR